MTDGHEDEDHLCWLLDWYRCCCDGIWEHTHGLWLERYERPQRAGWKGRSKTGLPVRGWQLTIELTGIPVPVLAPRTLLLDTADGGWLTCSLTRDRFVGAGDAERVEQIVGVFRRWMEPKAPECMPAGPKRMAARLV